MLFIQRNHVIEHFSSEKVAIAARPADSFEARRAEFAAKVQKLEKQQAQAADDVIAWVSDFNALSIESLFAR